MKGSQGRQPDSSFITGGVHPANSNNITVFTNVFEDWSTAVSPIVQLNVPGAYFITMAIHVAIVELFSPGGVTGSIWSKIHKYVNGIGVSYVNGSERALTVNGETVTGTKGAVQYVQFIDTIAPGDNVGYVPALKTDISGTYAGTANGRFSTATWLKLT